MGYYISTQQGVKLYVEDLNPGYNKTILFLHGWPGSHKLFEYQFNQLPNYGFRCIGVDTRGFGSSDKPYYGYDYDTLADDVHCVIDTLGLENITLLGHSTGGAIAVRYMARHQGYGVSKLILCAAAAPSLIKRQGFPYGLDESVVMDMIKNTLTDRPNMLRNFGNLFYFRNRTGAFSDWLFQLGLQAASWATVAIEYTWLNEVLFEDLEKIDVPTLIIHGIHDEIVPFELGEIQQKSIQNAVLLPFRFSGHATFFDQMNEFGDEVMKFVNH